MDHRHHLRRAVKGFYAWVGAMLIAAIAPFFATRLIESSTTAGRAAGVIVGTVAWLPMVAVIVSIIRQGDEFVRRIHLVAIAVAFAAALLLIMLLDWLVTAHFLGQPPLRVLWLAIALLWFVSLLAVKRWYERQS